MFSRSLCLLVALVPAVLGAQAPTFEPPSINPLVPTSNYTGASNGTLQKQPVVAGKVFDRFIQIWLENTDYNDAASTAAFQKLKEQGILLSQYYAVTHPSEPNYVAAAGGDFWGMGDDNFYNIPSNVSTIVDLLESKAISWASYQESMPVDGDEAFNASSANYLNASAPSYFYYERKHNPTIIYDSVATVDSRRQRHRNFNDLAADVNASAIPQWLFITPNMINDGHDTSIDFAGSWLDYFMPTMLAHPAFNDNRTLILLTFDETETYTINNRIFTLLLGGAVPDALKNTTDDTFYTHYSTLSTVENNWDLPSLGRQDANKTVSNVFALVANKTGYSNEQLTEDQFPLLNLTGTIAGPLNPTLYVPFVAPDVNAHGAGNGTVFVGQGVNASLTALTAPAPVNLTQANETVPASGPRANSTDGSSNSTSGSGSGSGSSGSGGQSSGAESVRIAGAAVVGVLGAAVALVL